MALQDKKIMPPPWLAFPEIERYSIGWGMGYGEDYMYRFGVWLDTRSPEERAEYRTLFPEPVTWKGWWDDEDSSEALEHGDFLLDAWQPEGRPKYTRQWPQQEFAAGGTRELCLFWGHPPSEDDHLTKSCLSQWWMEDFCAAADSCLCMEQYMMAAKAERFGDKEIRDQILKCSDQKQIKALPRHCGGAGQKAGRTAGGPQDLPPGKRRATGRLMCRKARDYMKDFSQYGNRPDDQWERLPWIPDPRPPFKIWVKPEQIAPFFLIPHHPYAISLLLKISDGFRVEEFCRLGLTGSSAYWERLVRGVIRAACADEKTMGTYLDMGEVEHEE